MNFIIKKLDKNEEGLSELLLMADPSYDMIKKYIDKCICYGIYLGNELVGQYSILNIKKDIMEIMNISVNEKYQGRGLGKQLIFHAINFAKEEKAKILEIGTGNSSINQLKLYQKCGFRINGIYKDYFKLNYDEEIFENDIRCIDMIRLSINL